MKEYPITAVATAVWRDTLTRLARCREAGATVEGPFHDEFIIIVPDDKREAVFAMLSEPPDPAEYANASVYVRDASVYAQAAYVPLPVKPLPEVRYA